MDERPFTALRREYETAGIDAADLDPDPLAQFRRWFDAAVRAGVTEPEAMVLATTAPAARHVLLRGLDARGFTFYTNRESAKGREIAADPRVALTFAWLELHRTVRVTGTAALLPDAESDAYFAARPRGAQLGAWASAQSGVLAGRQELEARLAAVAERFPEGTPVQRPPHWGGYVVAPDSLEFWQGRPSRLHDRLRYVAGAGAWRIERLFP